MNSRHIQIEALRKYLLRTLSGKEADEIEERYFSDSAFFQQVRAAEMDLIGDYLDGRLTEQEREQFEGHYLHVNTLRKLVNDFQEQRMAEGGAARSMAVSPRSGRRMFYLRLAGAVVCVAIIGLVLRYRHSPPLSTTTQVASTETPSAVLDLSPGTSKGPDSSMPELVLRDSTKAVSLIAKLPGKTSSALYTARLFNVDLGGKGNNVWTGNGIRSTPRTGGEQVIIHLPSTSIPPGDYILDLEIEGGDLRETYLFRVTKGTTE